MEKKTFGTRLPCEYTDRVGAYIIPIENGKVAVVRTEKGFFLIGGGIEAGEDDRRRIARECMEETGCSAVVGELLCAAEAFMEHPQIGQFHPIQRYYTGSLCRSQQPSAPTEHELCWLSAEQVADEMFLAMQGWAIRQALQGLGH